jgi:hypothetical protein
MDSPRYSVFAGTNHVVSGPLETVLPVLKQHFDRDPGAPVLVFDDRTGSQVDFDLRGPLSEILARAVPQRPRIGPGRPKLGVTSREISLLPRHWEWLERQPNGASATIRRLVDQARKKEPGDQRTREAVAAAGRFLSAIAGNYPNFEEATRALYARDRGRFEDLVRDWPHDIRVHALSLLG